MRNHSEARSRKRKYLLKKLSLFIFSVPAPTPKSMIALFRARYDIRTNTRGITLPTRVAIITKRKILKHKMRCERTRFVLKFLYSISKDEEKLAMILRKTIVKNILIDIIWTVKPLPPSHKLRLEHEEGLRNEKQELSGATTNTLIWELWSWMTLPTWSKPWTNIAW